MRVYNYLIIIVGSMILFYLSGINTGTGYVLNNLGVLTPEGINLTNFVVVIAVALATAVVGGIVIGTFTKSPTESIILVAYAELLLLFSADIIFIITYTNANYSGWIAWITGLIMIPLAIGYLHSVISWWGGKA